MTSVMELRPGMKLHGEKLPVTQVIRHRDFPANWRDPAVCDRHHVHIMIGKLWSCFPTSATVRVTN